MITPVFASLSPRSVSRQPRQAEPAAPLAQPNGNPVALNGEAIPDILNDIQQIMRQRRAQNQNVVRFGMDAQPPEDPNQPGLPGHGDDEPPGTPPEQGIPEVVPNAPRPNRLLPRGEVRPGDGQPLLGHWPRFNLLPFFNQQAQFHQPQQVAPQPQAQVQPQQQLQPQPPQSPSVQSTQTRVEMHSPAKSVNDSSQ